MRRPLIGGLARLAARPGARSQVFKRTVLGSACVGLGAGACAFAATPAEMLGGPARINKEIHELEFSVSASIADKFSDWLPGYLNKLLELPGLLGAKILEPQAIPGTKPAVIFVLGGPGAGKGTQSEYIVKKYGYVHLSAGDLLRAERKSGSAQGQLIDEYIKDGKIVPVEITVTLLMNAIEANGGKRFLVDGFPRNTNNLSGWQQVTGDKLNVLGVLFYDCPEEVMEARLLERGKTSGRTDDNIDSIRKRFRTYTNETQPILYYYEQQGLLRQIDGTQPVEMVWTKTQEVIDAFEEDLASQPPITYRVHLHATEARTLEATLSAELAREWGAEAIGLSVESFTVTESLKAYGLDALRSFD